MDAFALRDHLEEAHDVDWADTLDAEESNRLHHYVHHERDDARHDHHWAGRVADPQPPMGDPT